MDVGLLNATQYCAKDHDRKRMILQENQNNGEFYELKLLPACCQFSLLMLEN